MASAKDDRHGPSLLISSAARVHLPHYLRSCNDDGHQATLQLWDLREQRLVQEMGGIRKVNQRTCACAHLRTMRCTKAPCRSRSSALTPCFIPRLKLALGRATQYNAPTSIAYMGYDKAFWVRDTTLYTLHWADSATA